MPTTTSPNETDQQLLQAVAANNLAAVKIFVTKPEIGKSLHDADGQPLVYTAIKKIGKKPENASYSQDQVAAYKIAKLLIKRGFDLKQGDYADNTALHQAVKGKHGKLIDLLISKNADVNAKNQDGKTPLCLAVEANDVAIFTQIVNAEKIDPYFILNNPTGTEAAKTIFHVLAERQTQSGDAGKLNRESAEKMQAILKERVKRKNLRVHHIDNLPILAEKTQTLLPKMQQDQRKIFMSYSWDEKTYSTLPMVLNCRDYLKQNQIAYYLDRDEERGIAAIGEGHLERFMRTAICESHVTIAFINEAYLKSRNCLFELSQFWDKSDKANPKFKDNLHIVIHPEFDLYGNATNATAYINYWIERKKGNSQDAKTIDDITQQRQHVDEAEFLKDVADNIAGMINYIATKRVYPSYEKLRTSGYYEVMQKATQLNPPSLPEPNHNAGVHDFRQKLNFFQTKIDDWQQEKSKLEKDVKTLKEDIQKNQKAERENQQQIKTVQEELAKLKQSLQDHAAKQEELTELRQLLKNNAEKQPTEKNEQIMAQIKELEDKLKTAEEAKTQIKALETQLKLAEEAKAKQENTVSKENKKLAEYENQLKDLDEKIKSFDKQQGESQAKQALDTTALNKLQTSSASLEEQLNQLKETVVSLQTALNELTQENKKLHQELEGKANTTDLNNLTGEIHATKEKLASKVDNQAFETLEQKLHGKASATDLENLAGKIHTAETQLASKVDNEAFQTLEQRLQSKANATDLNNLTDEVNATKTDLALKANKTELENLSGEVNATKEQLKTKIDNQAFEQTLERKLQTKASAIDLSNLADRVNATETQLSSKVDRDAFEKSVQNKLNKEDLPTNLTSRLESTEAQLTLKIDHHVFQQTLEQNLQSKANTTDIENLAKKVNAAETQLALKADKETLQTLEQKLETKANTTELDNLKQTKADKTDLALKTDKPDIDKLASRINITETQLTSKVDNKTLEQSLQSKANATDLALKASKTDVDKLTSRVNITETQLTSKVDNKTLEQSLQSKANATDLALKTDKTDVDKLASKVNIIETQLTLKVDNKTLEQSLQSKANATDLALKANKTEVDNLTGEITTTKEQLKSKVDHDALNQSLEHKADKNDLEQFLRSTSAPTQSQPAPAVQQTQSSPNLYVPPMQQRASGISGNIRVETQTQVSTNNALPQSTATASPSKVSFFQQPPVIQQAQNPLDIIRQKSREVREKSQVTDKEVSELLKEVGKGHLAEVKQMLQSNRSLLYAQGAMVDVTDKTYKDITVLQYAYIVGDIDMCEMILEEFKKAGDEAMIRYQLNAEVIQKLGGVYALKETLEAYEAYIKSFDANYNAGNYDQLKKDWCQKIGGCQKSWPAWLRYDFTQEGGDAPWCKQSVCGRPQKRDDSAYGLNENNCWLKGDGNRYKLGENFGLARGSAIAATMSRPLWGTGPGRHDHKGLNNEEAAIKGYRATLEKRFQLSHGSREIASETLAQKPASQPSMG